MVLAGKPAIGLLYVVGRGRSRKPENLVEITWSGGHASER